jgi:hypothetical protein
MRQATTIGSPFRRYTFGIRFPTMRDPRRYSGAGDFVFDGRDYAWALKLDADRLPVTPFNVISIRLALLEASAPPVSFT